MKYHAEVRAAAAAARARASTPGKEATYAAKLAEAKSIKHGAKMDADTAETNYPYTFAEARRRNTSLEDAKEIIIGNANRVAGQLLRIDETELDALAAIKGAPSIPASWKVRTAALKALAE